MFQKNPRSQQPLLFSDINILSDRSNKILTNSWAATFRKEVFLQINESMFEPMFSKLASRPNTPINILMSLEMLKWGKGWTDEELYENFLFDLQVRYAVGCDNFGENEFCMRSIYYFRQRLVEYALLFGLNPVKELFEQITDKQIEKMGLKTDKQRLDSSMLMSNIADLSRLELLVSVMQCLWRMLSKADQSKYAELLQPYTKGSAGQYTYKLKGQEVVWEHIKEVGLVLKRLLDELEEDYGANPIYAVAKRFFEENFVVEEGKTRAKNNNEIGPGCLQSLDDLEATYRKKGNRGYKGYTLQIAETCNRDNPVQLIDGVQVAPNQVSDIQLLKEGLIALKERTGMDTAVTDGGYVSPEIDRLMREQGVEQITTGLTGSLPDHEEGKLALSDFDMQQDQDGEVTQVTCPAGQIAILNITSSGNSYRLEFDALICRECSNFKKGLCPIKSNKKQTYFRLTVPKERANSAQRRRHFERHKEEARNLRTAVEASVFHVKYKWTNGKVRVRGLFRVTTAVICSAICVNMRRIDRYRKGKLRGKQVQAA
ncbi:MAG: transposase [Candidatus Babeliaceae bacterium]|nr:transposase [Candidatus Babeliaceae bacterium]